MSGFHPVNAPPTLAESQPGASVEAALTPTTPRPPHPPADANGAAQPADDPSAKTPTRDSFHGISGQRPLPTAPYTPPHEEDKATARKDAPSLDAEDVDMQDDDGEEDGSDGESVNSDSTRPNKKKKKKGQRFFCTDFPPCQLSFTRSEHLARHIRKHTGERPFQCHCSRRFSRLDNLRQHAQTVHVNEDIPGDSLAATGTRFQRQIRTDRVRPPPSRARASTLSGSATSHGRGGHSRNLSTSSIASTVSTMSTATQLSQSDDFRRRPATLAMASGVDLPQRQRLSLETFNPPILGGSPGPTFYAQQPEGRSPGGYNTPPPPSYSSTTSSPRFSGLQSPSTSASRPYSYGGPPTSHSRRLSQPASAAHNPFQHPTGTSAFQSSQYVPSLPSGSGQAFQSSNSSVYASPTSSTFPSNISDRPETSAEAEWRRRTWHPSTHTQMRPATSGLSRFENADTLDTPERMPVQGPTRLPGIESFDHAPPLPALPRLGSPMQIDPPQQQQQQQQQPVDMGIQQGIGRLEIANPDSRNETRPAHQPSVAEQYQALVMHPGQPTGPQLPSLRQQDPVGAPPPIPQRSALRASAYQPLQHSIPQAAHQPVTQYATQASPNIVRFSDTPPTPRQNKRRGWYNGPPSASHDPQYAQGPPTTTNDPSSQQTPTPTQTQTQTQTHAQQPMTHSRGSSTNTIRTSPEESPSSEGVPTPASSNLSGYSTTNRHSNGFFRPLSGELAKPGADRFEHRSDLSSWSLQGAQNESRKREREREERDREGDAQSHYLQNRHVQHFQPLQQQQSQGPIQQSQQNYQPQQQQQQHQQEQQQMYPQHQPRDSGVAMGQSPTPHIDSGMRRLEALVAVATGESRA